MHGFHEKTSVIFFAEINKNAVSCWNSKSTLRPSNVDEISRDNVTLVYPNDLNVRFFSDRIALYSKQDAGRKEIKNNFSFSFFIRLK